MDLIKRFKILLSAPGDVQEELWEIEKGIKLFNKTMGEAQDMLISIVHWSENAFPEHGDRPQEILNKQIVKDCDAVIAVFGTRFGSPTGKYESGTEEEIEEMIESGKQVFLYFSEVPKDLAEIDMEQFEKVKAYKANYQQKGLYFSFKSLDKIEKKVHSDLSLYFLKNGNDNNSENKVVNQSRLEVETYINDSFEPKLIARKFRQDFSSSLENHFIAKVKGKVLDINRLKIEKAETKTEKREAKEIIESFNRLNSVSTIAVDFPEGDRSVISAFINARTDLSLDENFFYLGDLSQSRIYTVGNEGYTGSKVAMKKFTLLRELLELIQTLNGIKQWFSSLTDLHLVTPVLRNIGNTFDEDITVDIFFEKNVLFNPVDLQIPNFESSEFITDHALPFLFTPKENTEVEKYDDYPEFVVGKNFIGNPFKTEKEVAEERMEEFLNWVRDNFVYTLREFKDKVVVTVQFKYLRQHSSMFFPAPILLAQLPEDRVKVRIRSKFSPQIFESMLDVLEL